MNHLIECFQLQLDPQEAGVIAIFVLLSVFVWSRRREQPQGRTSSATKEKSGAEKEREWGEWTPVKFAYPEFPAYTLNLSDIKPIPYRPFRWGQYHVTMGIRDMPWGEWIELDKDFPTYYAIRNHRLHSRGDNVLRILPDRPGIVGSAYHAAVELAHELSDYVTKRYPADFTATRDSRGVIKAVRIHPVNVQLELPLPLLESPSNMTLREVSQEEAEQAMRMATLLVQDDLALMIEGTNGKYYFQGGAICVPGFWRLRDKIGLPLDEIHITGNVPQYQEKLHTSLGRFFKRLPVHKPVVRNNYLIQIVKPENMRRKGTVPSDIPPKKEDEDLIDPLELSWSVTGNGNEDTFLSSHRAHPDVEPIVEPETLHFRTERQTLRRLPLSGAVVFGIRTYLVPVVELVKEPGVPARLASAVRSWPEELRRYKGSKRFEPVLLEYLNRCAEEQRKGGGEEMEKFHGRGYPF
ncbi:hypothetical protein L218DRAFT_1004180 [Marasmius fiardii PR-910]|nr:hypothetical protein L218DRAFT_1004180 [Marasmius fiardii PR-910]